MNWNFRFLDILLLIATALVGWNLSETIELKNRFIILESSADLRLQFLEKEADEGERFTYDMGETLKGKTLHNRDIMDRHINRTEPKISDIHDRIINKFK